MDKLTYYNKLFAAIVGLVVLMAARHGFDLAPHTSFMIDALVAAATAIGVYQVKNKEPV